MMPQIQTTGPAAAPPTQNPQDLASVMADAPPKQVATAMERLSRAARLIAEIRIGADRLLEVLFLSAESPHQSNKTIQFVLKEEATMRQHFQDLRSLGKHLEDSGVLNGSVKLRGNSWGLHMPLVCPDGAVVAYAWKRQLAGQAGASAVDRTRIGRLALKAFTDQKRRFFPHLEDEVFSQYSEGELGVAKKLCVSHSLPGNNDELREGRTLHDVINTLQGEAPNVRIYTYHRFDWFKRASSLSSLPSHNLVDSSNEHNFQNTSNLRSVLGNVASFTEDHIAVIELTSPSVFRAVVSLHPAGSISPDAVAFFSTDEGGSYVHARGFSVFHVFHHVTEHADKALQYFQSIDLNTSLLLLLRWICSYQTLFTKICCKCGRLLMLDESLALILPPVHRSYHQISASKSYQNQLISSDRGHGCDFSLAYHIGCSADDS